MPYLIRKINRAKWSQIDYNTSEDISADVFGTCLKTSYNTLSVWRIESLNDIDDVALSIVTTFQHLDKIDLIIINEEDFNTSGLKIEESDGITHYSKMIKSHRDIVSLRYSSLGDVKNLLLKSLRTPDKVKKYTLKEVKELLKNAIDKGLIDIDCLNESIKNKLVN